MVSVCVCVCVCVCVFMYNVTFVMVRYIYDSQVLMCLLRDVYYVVIVLKLMFKISV